MNILYLIVGIVFPDTLITFDKHADIEVLLNLGRRRGHVVYNWAVVKTSRWLCGLLARSKGKIPVDLLYSGM